VHWQACLWSLTSYYLAEHPREGVAPSTWIAAYVQSERLDYDREVYPVDVHVAALYWSFMTLTSIGYGDIAATPKNAAEQVICTVLMLIGGCLWGYVIGTFCGALANLSPAVAEFRTNMNDLNGYIATNQINQPLARRLREFFHQTSHLADAPSHSRLLTMLSPALQSETVLTVNQGWLGKVWFLNHEDVSQPFVVRLAIALSPMILAPFEIAPHGYLYLLHRGVVVHTGRVLTKGHVWGEDIIVMALAPNLVRGTNARAMNYVESFITDWEMLEQACEGFPKSRHHIRMCALRLSLRREFVRLARLARRSSSGHRPESRKSKTIHKMLQDSTKADAEQVMLHQQLIQSRRVSAPT